MHEAFNGSYAIRKGVQMITKLRKYNVESVIDLSRDGRAVGLMGSEAEDRKFRPRLHL